MKTTLTITSRGVITLPAKLRQALGLKADDQLIAEPTSEGLLLRPAVTLPIEIYGEQRIREFDEAEAELARLLGRRPVLPCAFCQRGAGSFEAICVLEPAKLAEGPKAFSCTQLIKRSLRG